MLQFETDDNDNSYFTQRQMGDKQSSIELWLMDRRALSIRMKHHQNFPNLSVLQIYETYTKFHFLPGPDENIITPGFSEPSIPGLASFMHQLQQPHADFDPLEDDIYQHIAPRLWIILHTSVSATRKLKEMVRDTWLEAYSMIQDWNTLLRSLSQLPTNITGRWKVSEKRWTGINLSRNELANTIDLPSLDNSSGIWGQFKPLFEAYSRLYDEEQRTFPQYDENSAHSPIITQATTCENQNYYRSSERMKFLDSVYMNPTTATIDSLIMVSAPVQSLHPSVRLALNKMSGFLVSQEDDCQFDMWTKHSFLVGLEASNLKDADHDNSFFSMAWTGLPADKVMEQMVHFPYFFHEFQSRSGPHHDTLDNMNQVRMTLVSAVAYLEHLGIARFPLFGVAIDGHIARIISAWSDELDGEKCIFLGDRDTAQYNLTDPISAYNYATFMSKLVLHHGRELHNLLKIQRNIDPHSNARWTMDEQRENFRLAGYVPPKTEMKGKKRKLEE